MLDKGTGTGMHAEMEAGRPVGRHHGAVQTAGLDPAVAVRMDTEGLP